VDEHLLEAMEQRVRSQPEVMKQRKQLVEHPFGTMKRWWDAGYFFRRSLEKGRTEFSLTVLAYNLRRGLNRVERPRLLAALGGDGLGRSVVVRVASISGARDSIPMQASGCRKQSKLFNGGFSHSLALG
jgi:Transposase DDE domain